jgi:Cu(I)/Ag(I) efflux system membrane fusion protein
MGGFDRLKRLRSTLRIVAVRLRFIGLIAGAALLGASLDDLSAVARDVVVRFQGGRAAVAAPAAGAAERYVCPMHPDAVRASPGSCPACGMPLHRQDADEGQHVALGADKARLGGLRFARVERRPFEREVSGLALLELDERRVARVTTPVRAAVVAVHQASVGAPIRRGESLATLSSRDVAQLGRDLQRHLPADDATLLLARQRLLQLGLTAQQVDRLRTGRDPSAFELLAPFDGVLLAKGAVAGDQVPELTPIFTVADLSRLWLVARLTEEDALAAGPGAPIEAELVSAPELLLRGQVSWVDPVVDPATRTLSVRAVVENPRGLLRPGMTGRATLRVAVGSREAPPLVVPSSAVVDSGLRQIVWREDEAGILEPAEVKVASRAGALCAIASGLEEGDRIVVEGAFLLSADQRLRPARGAPEPHSARPGLQANGRCDGGEN